MGQSTGTLHPKQPAVNRLGPRERPDSLLVAEHWRYTAQGKRGPVVSGSMVVAAAMDKREQHQLLEDIDSVLAGN